jgi:predicted aconitase with swiveling domain
MPEGRTLVPGSAEGVTVVLRERLSFWGGLDPGTGAVIDVHHPQRGARIAGRVLVMPGGRGSSSSSYVLAEAIRSGTAPVAIVLAEPDPIVALGSIVARELYGAIVPVVQLAGADLDAIGDGALVRIEATAAGATVDGSSAPPG